MASYAGLLELRGPRGHTVLDLPPGVLEAAAHAVPPAAFRSFVHSLLHKCSDRVWGGGPITLANVLLATALFECPGISQAHTVAFCRRLWPRQETIAQLEQHWGVNSADTSSLRRMDPKLRQLVETVFAQESEWVHAAVLQHLVDGCRIELVSAPRSIELVLTGEAPSMTTPDDPRLHQLLRQLHAEVHAELRRRGKAEEVGELPPAAPPALASQLQGGRSSSSEESSPGTPPGQDSGGDAPSAAATNAADHWPAKGSGSGAVQRSAVDRGPGGGGGGMPGGVQCVLRHRRHH